MILFCVSKIELKAELLLWNELWSFILTLLITVMKSPSFMVICRTTDRYLCFDFDCCCVLTIKQVSFENKSWNLFVLQPEGAAVDAGLLGTEPKAPGGRAHVWRSGYWTRVDSQHRRSSISVQVWFHFWSSRLNWQMFVSADVLFTGTADGKIVKLVGRRIHTVTKLGKPPCGEKKMHEFAYFTELRWLLACWFLCYLVFYLAKCHWGLACFHLCVSL